MKKDKSRIDIPGFSYGERTGEYIDVPQIYGGRPTPKRSGRPHVLTELQTREIISRAKKQLQDATQLAKRDHSKRKAVKTRKAHKAIEAPAVKSCTKRFLEFLGMHCTAIGYVETPELFVSNAKQAYEITDGLCPIMTVTSAREALIVRTSFAKFGLAVEFKIIAVPRA